MPIGSPFLNEWANMSPDREDLDVPVSFREVAIYLNFFEEKLTDLHRTLEEINRRLEKSEEDDDKKRTQYFLIFLSSIVSPCIVAFVIAIISKSVK